MTGFKSKRASAQDKLAQPEQEPLEYWNAVEGWVKVDEVREHFDSVGCGTIYKTAGEDRVPLYTTPPQRPWVDLTRTQIQDVYFAVLKEHRGGHQMQGQLAFGEALQAAIKEKNT